MLFHTNRFLGFFLVVLAVYWTLPRHRWRMGWLLAASCVFYLSWNPYLIGLVLFSASVDFVAAHWLEHSSSARLRRGLLVGSITINLGLLAFFKYANFFLSNTTALAGLLGWDVPRPILNVLLPLGISFYTFETIAYIVDVYQGKTRAVRNYAEYALYIMFFPHLIAGPIVRPRDFLPQIGRPKRFSWNRARVGVQLFLLGFFKKAVIADRLAEVVDPIFNAPTAYGSAAVWLAVVSYAVQIYCDFSGYSDMALGTAHLLAFKLPRNFDMPYFAANVSQFWKRWHISLSTWLRDYLYIPLGGSRYGRLRTYRNLLVTMGLGGLWHGANWTFAVWGLYHGLLLVLHRALPRPRWWTGPAWRGPSIVLTFLCVCIGWVFFRAANFATAATLLGRMFHPTPGASLDPLLSSMAVSLLLLVLTCHVLASMMDLTHLDRWLPAPAAGAALALMLTVALFLVPENPQAFIYFQF